MLHELKLTANQQTLQCDSIKLASGLVENIECEFTLDSSWEGYDYLRALFTDNYGNVIEKTLTNNKCNVPNECLSHKGWCKVNLCAYDVISQQKVLQMTSYMTKICDITQEVAVDGDNTVAPTTQVWEQELLNILNGITMTAVGGQTAGVVKSLIDGHWNFAFTLPKGDKGDTGQTGATGNGIASITKTGTSGLVDTYTITYTNGGTVTFTVTNGEDGEDGEDGRGVTSITKTSTSGLIDTYTITYTDGTTSTFNVTNGATGQKGDTGDTGNGISSIAKTSTSALIDTYTITYTNGTTTTFNVTNGSKGDKGDKGDSAVMPVIVDGEKMVITSGASVTNEKLIIGG